MPVTVRMQVRPGEIIEAIKRMKKEQRDAFLEDLLASTSPEYLESIKEARADYSAWRVKTQAQAFGRLAIGSFTPEGP